MFLPWLNAICKKKYCDNLEFKFVPKSSFLCFQYCVLLKNKHHYYTTIAVGFLFIINLIYFHSPVVWNLEYYLFTLHSIYTKHFFIIKFTVYYVRYFSVYIGMV